MRLVHDMRGRINEVVRTGWVQMTLGMVGFFGFYYLLFVLIMHSVGRLPAARDPLRCVRHRPTSHGGRP